MNRKENIWFGTVIVLLLAVALTMGWLGWKTAPDAVQPHDISLAQGTLCFTTPGSEVRGKLVDDIAGAHTSVLVECYLISDPAVVEALQTAKLHGCDVRVIMEENPFGGFSMNSSVRNRLRSAGVDAVWGNRSYAFTHAKFVVVDERIAWLMTANLTKSAFDKNREVLVRTPDQAVIDSLVRVFWADRRRGTCPSGVLVLGPVNGRQALLSFLGSAQRTIDVVSEVFDDDQVAQVLKNLSRQGVSVRILVASPDEIAANRALRSWMSGTRVEVRYLETPYLHAKYLLVDGQVAYVGSANLSTGSLDDNREVGIVTSSPEVVPILRRTFDTDWSAGTS